MTVMLRDFKDEKIEFTENTIQIEGKSDDKQFSTKLNLFSEIDA